MKKGQVWELTKESVVVDGQKLHRVKAVKDLPVFGVKAGDLGGFVGGCSDELFWNLEWVPVNYVIFKRE